MSDSLIRVECPFMVKNRQTDELMKCPQLCAKVRPGSSGELRCRSCKRKFDFDVSSQGNTRLSVKAQKMPAESTA